ncbi:hypothetical protein [Natribacillus halophilus]|uniref:Uncharacterized protein n=1 Tax=Natribacillus halophilus TaxID=549003 RepID=A0A1G8LGN8_9BACI|nr:hypothetical protein [Natribacillus halophilus]SDI54813.1 hypothetical protein SAMN04488123_10383 [Natribacillus halophilus]
MLPLYPAEPYRHAVYRPYPQDPYAGEERIGFFLPFVAGLAAAPLLSGAFGGYGYGGPPPPISYGPHYGPSFGPNYGPNYGPIYKKPAVPEPPPGFGPGPGYGPPRPPYGW